jgi:phosphoribosylformylglycinamidine (FGAM) synthase PurS component
MEKRTVRITVGLKVTDNEARSALEALQSKMGLRESVRDLLREELWEVDVMAGSWAEARATVERLVRTTNLFANPNKHRYEISEAGGPDTGGFLLSPDEVAVLVRDRESTVGTSVLAAVHGMGVADVVGVRKWTRWRICLTKTPPEGDPSVLRLISRIAVTTGRRDGLLSNPHSQTSRAVLPWGEEKVLAA